jgi:ABC-type Fe3+ transport system permease subunit
VLAGAWRGAKFGGKWPAIILTILMVAIWVVYLAMIVSLWLLRGTDLWQTLKPLEFLKMIGFSLGFVLYVTFVTGMVGGLIMGVAAGISYRKGATKMKSDHEAKEPCSTDQPSG